MGITEDMMGGEWEQAVRHLHIELAGWADGRDVIVKLLTVEKAAKEADRTGTKGTLAALDTAVKQLERAVVSHEKRYAHIRDEVGYFVAAIAQAKTLGRKSQLEQDALRAAALYDPRFAGE
jgi:hypothetical protein